MHHLETALASVDLFKGLTKSDIREIARTGQEVEFSPGTTFVEAGLQASDFYLILEGQATLSVPRKPDRTVGPGDAFGEISVLDGGPRTASVTAVSRVLAFRLGQEEFLALLDRHGSIGRTILVEMIGRLRYAEGRLPKDA